VRSATGYKNFTLTHLSPQRPRVVSQRVLKAVSAHMVTVNSTGGSQVWNIVKILGKASVKAKTLNFTLSSKVKNCPFANNAGVV